MSTILESHCHFEKWSSSLGYFSIQKQRKNKIKGSRGSEKESTKNERGIEGKVWEGRERVEFFKPNINL